MQRVTAHQDEGIKISSGRACPCDHFEQSDRVESSPAVPQEIKTNLTITQRKLRNLH